MHTRSPKREQELEDCLSVIACVITHNGQAFWPVYSLVEEELEQLRARRLKLRKSLGQLHKQEFELALDSGY